MLHPACGRSESPDAIESNPTISTFLQRSELGAAEVNATARSYSATRGRRTKP